MIFGMNLNALAVLAILGIELVCVSVFPKDPASWLLGKLWSRWKIARYERDRFKDD